MMMMYVVAVITGPHSPTARQLLAHLASVGWLATNTANRFGQVCGWWLDSYRWAAVFGHSGQGVGRIGWGGGKLTEHRREPEWGVA